MSNRSIRDRMGRPLSDLRISLIDECNFRCTYCMPKELFGEGHPFLPRNALLSFDEITRVVRRLAPLGVRKIKLTGGEPLLRPGVHDLVARLWEIPGIEDIGLITNGSHLASVAPALERAGLSRVTVSLDSLDQDTFDRITGRRGGLQRVLDGIEVARGLAFAPVKVNMVVQRGVNSDEVLAMAERFRETGVILRFIEYMDVGRRNEFARDLLVPNAEIRDALDAEYGIEPIDPGYYGEVAERYRYRDGGGEVGFISSMTQPFCRNCTRLRLSADGKLYRCLFSGIGMDVKAILRGDAAGSDADDSLTKAVRRFWGLREDRYSELRGHERPPGDDAAAQDGSHGLAGVTPRNERVEMYRMGG